MKVHSVLIVGGGTSGQALAIFLRRAGLAAEIVEIAPTWSIAGSGITLKGNALRVLREVGVWDEVAAAGFGFDDIGMCAPDGSVTYESEDTKTGGPDLPATLGIPRPTLQDILVAAGARAEVPVRLGLTVDSLATVDERVRVRFSDGTSGDYDVVVGADGLRSRVRTLIGIADAPRHTGMGIWRVLARRPQGVRRTDLFYGGPSYIAGYCPISETHLYAYIVEPARDRGSFTPEQMPALMRALAAGYGGAWREIAADITEPARINYTWFESLLVDRPWHRGRVVLIGDAAHACPPTLAQGAAMGLEDAAVLAELLITAARPQDAFEAFTERRYGRVRAIVTASLQLAEWQQRPAPDVDPAGLIQRTQDLVTSPP